MNETMADLRMGSGKGRGEGETEGGTEGCTEGVTAGSAERIAGRTTEQPGWAARLAALPLFMCGFRPFFLATALYSVLVVLAWTGFLGIGLPLPAVAGGPFVWHAHELMFGFGLAAVAGFVLTAVPEFTATPAFAARVAVRMVLLWLAARAAFWLSGSLAALVGGGLGGGGASAQGGVEWIGHLPAAALNAGFALAVVAIDIGKGAVAAALAWLPPAGGFAPLPVAGLLGFACAVGHVWPLYFGFRGGKGAATAVGGLLVLWPWVVPALLLAWFLVLVSTGYVGLSTVLAAALLPLLAWWWDAGPERLWFAIAMAVFIAFTHRSNLLRLWQGNEARFERARLLYRLHGRSRY